MLYSISLELVLWIYAYIRKGSLAVQMVKKLPAMWQTWAQFLGWEDTLEGELVSHSNILMDRGALWATVHRVTKSWTWLVTNIHISKLIKMQILNICNFYILIVVQSLSHVWLLATPWTAAHQASLSFTISQSLLKLMSIELMMPSNHLIFCCPLLLLPSVFPSIFPMNLLFTSGGQCMKLHLPMNIQGWFPLGLTGLVSLLSKGHSRVFSNTTIRKD